MNTLKGLYVEIQYHENEKQIVILDLVDTNNEPAMMTRSKRGIEQVWEKIRSEFSASWTWSNAIKPIEDAGIKTHYWCRVD